MAFDLLSSTPQLYPLYSDMDSDIENTPDPIRNYHANNDNMNNNRLMVPSPIRRHHKNRRSKSPNSRMNKTYNYYKAMQDRNRMRGRNRIYRNINNNINGINDGIYHKQSRHIPKSSSLSALSTFSSLSIIASPRPINGVQHNYNNNHREFVYNVNNQQNEIKMKRRNNNININNNNNENNNDENNIDTYNKSLKKVSKYQQKKRRQKRRIRTFYSKKWGNRLYGLTNNYSSNIIIERHNEHNNHDINNNNKNNPNNNKLDIWRNEITNARRSLCAFIEEERLDLNDRKCGGCDHEYISPSPSPSPVAIHLGDNDFRMPQDTNTVYYDSAVSNIAANTDIDDNDSDDDDNNNNHGQHQATPNPQIMQFHDENGHYSNDLEVPNTPNTPNITNLKQEEEEILPCRSNFKIVVSGPNNEDRMGIMNMNDMNIMNEIDVINMSINDRQNELMSRLKPKRSRRRYIRTEIESGASDDCSSSDYDDDEDGMTTENEMENDNNDLLLRNSLFLSDNNLKRGVYASFSFSDSETDYLSAQSDDFDELTICYHNRNNNNKDRNNRNIRFRTHHLQDANYLSDIGPSDIGSSDTECFSSNDSIPDSIPPPVHPDFVSIN